jgi:hypothetical protein
MQPFVIVELQKEVSYGANQLPLTKTVTINQLPSQHARTPKLIARLSDLGFV